jgi:SET domain-containing protein
VLQINEPNKGKVPNIFVGFEDGENTNNDKFVGFYALRAIHADEELTTDYGPFYARHGYVRTWGGGEEKCV